ncbi:Phosphoglycolate phosphatase [bacterium HR40]|nr:Phosphoglycolate phosphatase [bacterium HR40]
MAEPQVLRSLAEIAEHYDAFLFDQWGVMHDGRCMFPGVIDALAQLAAAGKRIVLLSNSGRRASYNDRRLAEMGLDLSLLAGSVTSGEVAYELLKARSEPPFSELGRRCYLLTRFGDLGVVEGLDLELVDDVDKADFLFITGVDSPLKTLEDYLPIVQQAAIRRIPAICSNPDRIAPVGGHLALGPGAVAEAYEKLGGPVTYIGKPASLIYDACLSRLPGVARERILAIGDSASHDVVGAKRSGLAVCLVTSGIHRDAFAAARTPAQVAAVARQLGEEFGAIPDFVIERVRL